MTDGTTDEPEWSYWVYFGVYCVYLVPGIISLVIFHFYVKPKLAFKIMSGLYSFVIFKEKSLYIMDVQCPLTHGVFPWSRTVSVVKRGGNNEEKDEEKTESLSSRCYQCSSNMLLFRPRDINTGARVMFYIAIILAIAVLIDATLVKTLSSAKGSPCPVGFVDCWTVASIFSTEDRINCSSPNYESFPQKFCFVFVEQQGTTYVAGLATTVSLTKLFIGGFANILSDILRETSHPIRLERTIKILSAIGALTSLILISVGVLNTVLSLLAITGTCFHAYGVAQINQLRRQALAVDPSLGLPSPSAQSMDVTPKGFGKDSLVTTFELK